MPPSPDLPPDTTGRNRRTSGCLWLAVLVLALLFGAACLWGYRAITATAPDAATSTSPEAAERHIARAEQALLEEPHATAFGNEDQALKLADGFSQLLPLMRRQLFPRADPELVRLTRKPLPAFCFLGPDTCAFLLRAPGIDSCPPQTRDDFHTLAWCTAWTVLQKRQLPVRELAVGVRGDAYYAVVEAAPFDRATVEPPAPAETAAGPDATRLLQRFFSGAMPQIHVQRDRP